MKPHLDFLYDLQKPGFLSITDEKTGNVADYDLKNPLCLYSEFKSAHNSFTVFTVSKHEGKNLFDTIELRFSKTGYRFIQSGPTICVDQGGKSFRFELPPGNCTDFDSPGNMLFFKQMVISLPDVYEIITQRGLILMTKEKSFEFLSTAQSDINNIFNHFNNFQ